MQSAQLRKTLLVAHGLRRLEAHVRERVEAGCRGIVSSHVAEADMANFDHCELALQVLKIKQKELGDGVAFRLSFDQPRCSFPAQRAAECMAQCVLTYTSSTSEECENFCSASVAAVGECSLPKLSLSIDGASDSQAARRYKALVEENLGPLLEVTVAKKEILQRVIEKAERLNESNKLVSDALAPSSWVYLFRCVPLAHGNTQIEQIRTLLVAATAVSESLAPAHVRSF